MDKTENHTLLRDTTIALLRERLKACTLPELYYEMRKDNVGDGTFTFAWLRKFSLDRIPDPSVNRVQALYEYLSGTALLDG